MQQAGMQWEGEELASRPFAEDHTFTNLCTQQLLGILVPCLQHLVPVARLPSQPLCCHTPAMAHAASTVSSIRCTAHEVLSLMCSEEVFFFLVQ